MTGIISTDHPLGDDQKAILTALLNTLIPPSDDGHLPGAGNLDLREFMNNVLNPDFNRVVLNAISSLGEEFLALSTDARVDRVSALSNNLSEEFAQLYTQALAVYYRQDAVLRGIGSREGPPFPRGNEVADGDMSLLDPVIAKPKHYRPA